MWNDVEPIILKMTVQTSVILPPFLSLPPTLPPRSLRTRGAPRYTALGGAAFLSTPFAFPAMGMLPGMLGCWGVEVAGCAGWGWRGFGCRARAEGEWWKETDMPLSREPTEPRRCSLSCARATVKNKT